MYEHTNDKHGVSQIRLTNIMRSEKRVLECNTHYNPVKQYYIVISNNSICVISASCVQYNCPFVTLFIGSVYSLHQLFFVPCENNTEYITKESAHKYGENTQ